MTKQAQTIALFYYYAFLDERMVLELSAQAFQLFQNKVQKINAKNKKSIEQPSSPTHSSPISQSELNSILVNSTYKVWHLQKKNQSLRYNASTFMNTKWKNPSRSSIEPWKEYLKFAAGDEQILFLIWAHILKIPIADISQGLQIPEGTVRFKLSRGLKDLSEYVYFGNNPIGITQ